MMFKNNLENWHGVEMSLKMKRIMRMAGKSYAEGKRGKANRFNSEINALIGVVELNAEINKHGKTKIIITQF